MTDDVNLKYEEFCKEPIWFDDGLYLTGEEALSAVIYEAANDFYLDHDNGSISEEYLRDWLDEALFVEAIPLPAPQVDEDDLHERLYEYYGCEDLEDLPEFSDETRAIIGMLNLSIKKDYDKCKVYGQGHACSDMTWLAGLILEDVNSLYKRILEGKA